MMSFREICFLPLSFEKMIDKQFGRHKSNVIYNFYSYFCKLFVIKSKFILQKNSK
jgi:hypothetical protein